MKKRIRKKLHKGEFSKFGFELEIKFKDDVDYNDFEKWLADFIEQIEINNLIFGGGGDVNAFSGYVYSNINKYPSNIEILEIEKWLKKKEIIRAYKFGALVNMYE